MNSSEFTRRGGGHISYSKTEWVPLVWQTSQRKRLYAASDFHYTAKNKFLTGKVIMNAHPTAEKNITSIETSHGKVWLQPKNSGDDLTQKPIKKKSTGMKAVAVSVKYGISEAGLLRGTLPMLQMNQKDGFDCPGCAWPDPDGKRSSFEFCENGAKAVAHESDRRRIDAKFFAEHSVSELSTHTGYWLEQQGRLTEPMVLRENATHYTPISWENAYQLIADELNRLPTPDRASFYTSGKATNEAAFAYQLFVRQFGTNNLPDCSNMCHESSGRALTQMFGFGKGTVTLQDFEKAELVFVVGQNPGTNHPRQLTALQETKRAGGKIISVNPMPEAGLMQFMNPQEVRGMLGFSTKLTDLFLQVKVNGDIPLFKGILKQLVEWDDAQPGSAIDQAFVAEYTANLDALLADLRSADWDTIVTQSGIARDAIEEAATMVRDAEKIIICWCLGVTQHVNGTENVREMMNLLLLRGAIGKPGRVRVASADIAMCRAIARWACGKSCRTNFVTNCVKLSISNHQPKRGSTRNAPPSHCTTARSTFLFHWVVTS